MANYPHGLSRLDLLGSTVQAVQSLRVYLSQHWSPTATERGTPSTRHLSKYR